MNLIFVINYITYERLRMSTPHDIALNNVQMLRGEYLVIDILRWNSLLNGANMDHNGGEDEDNMDVLIQRTDEAYRVYQIARQRYISLFSVGYSRQS